jgi:hypothetical protein
LYVKTEADTTPSISIRPDDIPHGIVTRNSVAETNAIFADGIVAVPILTTEFMVKSVPVIVTIEPADPSTGENELIVVATKRTLIVFDFISKSDEKEEILINRNNKLKID